MSDQIQGAGTPGPAQGESNTPAAAPSGNPSAGAGAPSGAPAGTPASGQPAAGAAARQFTYTEDRSNWVPPHRIREGSERARQLEQALQVERQRVAALTGVQLPQSPADAETEAIKQELFKRVPELARLAKIVDKLEQFGQIDPAELTRASEHQYEILGSRTLANVSTEFQKVIGTDKLTPFAEQQLHTAFALFVRQSEDNAVMYERMDPRLVQNFIQEYTTGILDPYRRTVTTRQQPQPQPALRLPRGGSGSAIPGQAPAGKLKPADTDEYHGSAFRSLTSSS